MDHTQPQFARAGSDILPRRTPLTPVVPHPPKAFTTAGSVRLAQVPPVQQRGQQSVQPPAPSHAVSRPYVPRAPLRKEFLPPEATEDAKPSRFKRLQLPLVILLGIIGGILVESAPIGQTIIGIYGLLALILRIESRTSFAVGLLALASTVIMVAIQHNSLLAHTFAGYTLLLFVVGIICAAREVREQKILLTKKRAAGRRY